MTKIDDRYPSMEVMPLSTFRAEISSDDLGGRILLRHYNDPIAVVLPIADYNSLIEHRKLAQNNHRLLTEIHDMLESQDEGPEEIY